MPIRLHASWYRPTTNIKSRREILEDIEKYERILHINPYKHNKDYCRKQLKELNKLLEENKYFS